MDRDYRDYRDYIGARYVPKFMGAHDVTQAYEALCVVDNGAGTSYISKIPTPPNTPLTNTVYWAVYGASSGAIINLQDQIDEIRDGFVTPEMFGAIGNGLVDDSAAVSAAIDTGKTVVCGGTYLISTQIDKNNAILAGNGSFILNVANDFSLILRDDSVLDGLTFEGTGTKTKDGLKLTKRPHITNCTIKNFALGLTLSDVYTGNITKCDFKDNTTCVKFKNDTWGGNVACTSCEFLSTEFVTSDTGVTSENGESCHNIVFKECVFEYDYVNGINMYDTTGIIDSCWFEHINYTGSVAVKGVNCFFTTIMNKFINTVTTNYDLTQPSWNNVERGYTSIGRKSIDTRSLKLVDKYTQSDTSDRININGDDGDINVLLGANPLGHLLYTSASKLKVSEISVNTYQSTPVVRPHDSGFTFTKLSTGKYYVNFNRTIDNCSIFANAAPHDNTPADLNNLTISNIVHASIFGVNTGSVANYKQWKQADGAVVLVTDNNGALVDANFDLMVIETIV